jgi:hypothetical protein
MRKINYSDAKIQELMSVLASLDFIVEKQKDSIDVHVTSVFKKVLMHELSRVNGVYKTPPLTTQFDEKNMIVSIFDSRI